MTWFRKFTINLDQNSGLLIQQNSDICTEIPTRRDDATIRSPPFQLFTLWK